MRVFFNRANTNFGDHLNDWLWPRLIPEMLEIKDDRVLVGVGSLLKADLERVPGRKIIFGTGSGYGVPPTPDVAARWDIHAVRGPLTASQFGLSDDKAITDGAWLIDLLPEYATLPDRGTEAGVVPHWTSAALGNWQGAVEAAGMTYIDPLDDGPSILDRIARARLAVVESLHGAIFADYFRTPWVPVSSTTRVLHYKWVDWCRSLDLEYHPLPLPPSDAVDFLTQGRRPNRAMPEITPIPIPDARLTMKPAAGVRAAGAGYKAKMRVKAGLRGIRDGGLDMLRARRDIGPLKGWNAGYRDDLVAYLERIQTAEPFLSGDGIRAQRLDQLKAAFEAFKAAER